MDGDRFSSKRGGNVYFIVCYCYILFVIDFTEDDLCADQYATCSDFSKNEYCTKYPDLMKIQCRKSCGFCGTYSMFPLLRVSEVRTV